VTAGERYSHCPNCLTEYRSGYAICTDCRVLLVPGPSPNQEPDVPETPEGIRGVEVVRSDETGDEGPNRFALEETPIVLTVMVHEDADAFLATLDDQGIGARRGEDTGDGGVEIVVHAANLIDAQAVLVEFTGEVTLVDEIAADPEDVGDDDWAVVTWVSLGDAGVRANRLRDRGLDVRLELPAEQDRNGPAAQAAILVAAEDLETARRILRIEF
jgi:hypothetical protein